MNSINNTKVYTSNDLPVALVTGAAGFIGAHLVRALLRTGRVNVVALDDLSGGDMANLPAGVEVIQGSVTDEFLVAEVFKRFPIKYVYHLAAYAAEGLSHFIRRFNYTNNVIGSINVINQAINNEVEVFVFTSSIAVYGAITPPMREDSVPHPEDPYGVAKLAIEQDLAAAEKMFGMRFVVFRPHNVYGEYQNLADPYRNVIGIFMRQIRSGQPMTIFGDGLQERAFSYVGDVVPAIAESPWISGAINQIFNIGASTPCSVKELARIVAAAMGCPDHPIQHLPARNEVVIAYADHSKCERVFGHSGETSLNIGLAKMAEWAKTAPLGAAKVFRNIEVARNLPPSWARILKEGQEC